MTEQAVAEQKTETTEETTLLGQTADTTVETKPAEGKPTVDGEVKPEAKEGESKQEVKTVPEKYELKVPEGMTLDTALMEKMTPLFKEIGVTQEQAQKLADAYAPYVKAQVEATQKAAMDNFKAITDGWKTDTLKILGAEPDKAMAPAAKFLNTFGTPALREMLEETGLGNNPELVQAFIKAGKAIGTDSFADANNQSTGADDGLIGIYKKE